MSKLILQNIADDISEFIRIIINKPKYKKAIIVFIHGMENGKNSNL